MRELGIDFTGHRSKSLDDFKTKQFDYVITVCDNAEQTRLKAFPSARDDLLERLSKFVESAKEACRELMQNGPEFP